MSACQHKHRPGVLLGTIRHDTAVQLCWLRSGTTPPSTLSGTGPMAAALPRFSFRAPRDFIDRGGLACSAPGYHVRSARWLWRVQDRWSDRCSFRLFPLARRELIRFVHGSPGCFQLRSGVTWSLTGPDAVALLTPRLIDCRLLSVTHLSLWDVRLGFGIRELLDLDRARQFPFRRR